MDATDRQVALIRRLFDGAEARGLPLWLESGWAIDARLGAVTRAHDDVDVAYPQDREAEYLDLLRALGCGPREEEPYGFLCRCGGVLLDSEPCVRVGDAYTFPGFPDGACPPEKEGEIRGVRVRCLSWEAMYVEFAGYAREVPPARWRPKDAESLRLIEAHVPPAVRRALRLRAGL